MTLKEFSEEHCKGMGSDSCLQSTCEHASKKGCQHPLHPGYTNIDDHHLTAAASMLAGLGCVED